MTDTGTKVRSAVPNVINRRSRSARIQLTEGARTVRDFLLEFRHEKRTIVVSTHFLEEADRVCDRVAVLDNRLIAVGSPDELRRSLWGRATVVRLAEVTAPVVQAARALAVGDVTVTADAPP